MRLICAQGMPALRSALIVMTCTLLLATDVTFAQCARTPMSISTSSNVLIRGLSINAAGQVCTTISNFSGSPASFTVCYLRAEKYSLLPGQSAVPRFLETQNLGTINLAAGAQQTICATPSAPGEFCNGFQLKDASGNVCAMRSTSLLTIPPTPATTVTINITVGGNAPDPRSAHSGIDISVDLSNAPPGTSVNVQSSIQVPPQGQTTNLRVTITVPTAGPGSVKLQFRFSGSTEIFGEMELDVSNIGVAPGAGGVVVNEVFTGTPDHVELHNCSSGAIDVSGWTVQSAYSTGGAYTLETPFVLPAGTQIPAGGFLILEEFGTPGTPGTLPNSISVGFNYFWVANRSLEVFLTDPGGFGMDYVHRNVFAGPPAPNIPFGTNWTGLLTSGIGDDIARNMDNDTDDAGDWTTAAIIPTTAAPNAGQIGSCGPGSWETNDLAASLDIDGVHSNGFSPAVTNAFVCFNSTLTLGSNLAATPFELALNLAPLVPGGAPPAITTANGQFVNLNLVAPGTAYLNGGSSPLLIPLAATITITLVPPAPLAISGQAVLLDPGHPDGISLTQAVRYVVAANPPPFAGPATDDGTTLIDLAALGCGPVSFLGTNYDAVGVSANGRVNLGATDGDFSATIAEAQTDAPFIGYWTDFNPAVSGSITVTDNVNNVVIDYAGVTYFGEAATPNTFAIVFDRITGTASISGLQGIMMNPATSVTSSDSIFLGISPGSSAAGGAAVDPGGITFGMALGGAQGSPDDMLYDFFSNTSAVTGTSYRSGSLAAGTLGQIDFFDAGAGLTGWAGL